MKRKALSVLIAVAMIVSAVTFMVVPVSAADYESEPNDTWQTATPLEPNKDITGNLSSREDIDFFAVTLDEPGTFQVQMKTASGRYRVIVREYIEDIPSDIQNNNDYSGLSLTTGDNLRLAAGTYYVIVEIGHWSGYSNEDYILTVLHNPEPGADFEKEFNNTWQTATPLEPNAEITGNLSSREDIDFFTVTLDEPGTFQVQMKTASGRYRVIVREYIEDIPHDIQNNNDYSGLSLTTGDNLRLAAGTYYVIVEIGHWSGYSNEDYTLRIIHSPEPGADFEKEFNNTWQTATPLEPNKDITGNLSSREDIDFFTVTLDVPGTFQVRMKTISGRYRVIIREYKDGIPSDIQNNNDYSGLNINTGENIRLAAGTYYVIVEIGHWSGYSNEDYILRIIHACESGKCGECKECNPDAYDDDCDGCGKCRDCFTCEECGGYGDCEVCEEFISASSQKPGDVTGDGEITIDDVLEILKYLAKLPSVIDGNPGAFAAACITDDVPAIGCVLEVLKFLAGLESMLDEYWS